ncbi:gamma-soluble NSF attachment protein [Dendrobium catenatum]|uniref:gamma-soluble NSF attachment protein n=1 Tax=Dendrobium catenatum TaxID=906689 RepID=UPI0010A077BD|nr:gamma-soluble NSF attachment protein [Dendrobium catenatum]
MLEEPKRGYQHDNGELPPAKGLEEREEEPVISTSDAVDPVKYFSLLEQSGVAYLSAIIVYLYLHDFKQAQKCYDDCTQVSAFLSSDQSRCASKLLSAYREGDVEEIKRIAQSSIISHLDHAIIRLARKLPTGDLKGIEIDDADEQEALDEDNLV